MYSVPLSNGYVNTIEAKRSANAIGDLLKSGQLAWSRVNPLSPDSAIWHKMQLHAQYSVNLHEICTTKRSWKDLHFEGIILCPLLYKT